MKTLVVYYSESANTKQIAEMIARKAGTHVEKADQFIQELQRV